MARVERPPGTHDEVKLPTKRTVMVSVRLAPKVRFAAFVAARSQRRTISSLIETAVAAYLPTLEVMEPAQRPRNLMKLVEELWDPEESDRFVNLAEKQRWLLDSDEEYLWKAIRKHFHIEADDPLTLAQRTELHLVYKDIKEKVDASRDKEKMADFARW